jgi:two-component system phosphate regulon response regulator OmpR
MNIPENDSPAHILVVDDDTRLRSLLKRFLTENGYMVSVAADAAEARRHLQGFTFDLLVLDVMMPGETGLELTADLRNSNPVPILLLTALGEAEDRINGLEHGADDYLAKPFEPRELLLRIGNILRRIPKNIAETASQSITFGAFSFDSQREALFQGDTQIHLTTAEATLLKVLLESAGKVIAREELALMAGLNGNPRTIDVQVTRLRKKLEHDPKLPRHLQTVRGKGYLLRLD